MPCWRRARRVPFAALLTLCAVIAFLVAPISARAYQPPNVHYDIDVRLDTQRQQLVGWATIGYRSGADSALTAIWLHAYPNAFSSHRTLYAREGERDAEDYSLRFAPLADRGWMTLDSASVEGAPARVVVEETLARVELPRPLAPGDSTTFRVRFHVGIPRVFDRFGRAGRRYSVAQWYPKLVVNDERGWVRDPYHFFAEFYGEFANYDVAITLPDDFWAGATGVLASASGGDNDVPLQHPAADSVTVRMRAVAADSLAGRWPREALRLAPLDGETLTVGRDSAAVWRVPKGAPLHYRYEWSDSAGADPSHERDDEGRFGPVRRLAAWSDTAVTDTLRALAAAAAPGDSATPSLKTLRYHAARVHDFAFVAAPDYVRADTTWNGIAVRTLLYRDDAPEWKDVLGLTVASIRHHSELVGPYIWPQFTTAESFTAGGAMEYPMLIMNDPSITGGETEWFDATISHEIGHNWFYGMIANDERRDPWLDEGFTQFLEVDFTDARFPRGAWRYRDKVTWAAPMRWNETAEMAVLERHFARDEVPPSTPADGCHGYPQYAVSAYDRGAVLFRSLKGAVGEEKFRAFLGETYRRGVGRHIRTSDVYEAARTTLGPDGDRLIRPWIETTEVPDVALGGTRRERTASGFRTTVTVRRKGGIEFPVPVEARYADGTRETKIVPTPERRNEVVFEHVSPLAKVELDPRHEIFDAYRLDNQGSLLPPMRVRPLLDVQTTEAISVLVGPTLWHDERVGTRVGAWMDGRYLQGREFPRGIRSFEGGLVVGLRDRSVAWRAGYGRRVGALGARGFAQALATKDTDFSRMELTLSNLITGPGRLHPWRTWTIQGQWLDWDDSNERGTLNAGASFRVETTGPRRRETFTLSGWHGFGAKIGAPGSRRSYDRVSLEARQTLDLGARADFHVESRVYGGVSWRRIPSARLFGAAEATPIETLDRFYANARGPLRESEHWWAEGGGGLRGYVGRDLVGKRILAGSLEVRHDRWPVSLFVDAGRVKPADAFVDSTSSTLADAGIGLDLASLGIPVVGIRLYAPVWVGTPELGENPWEMRGIVAFDLPELRWR
ncbi:MAG TPA: M1 family metallopeptidase [Candidatus Eisenbacteria bacterium]|nr:M1 family metallopeptidase [Candidatus Eisenbacteria bacterium]